MSIETRGIITNNIKKKSSITTKTIICIMTTILNNFLCSRILTRMKRKTQM